MVNLLPIAAGLGVLLSVICSVVASEFTADKNVIRDLSTTYHVSFSPTTFLDDTGSSELGRSAVFGIMWTTIYFLNGFVVFVYLLVIGLANERLPAEDDLVNALAFVAASLFVSCAWPRVYTSRANWSFWASSAVLTTATALSCTAVAIYRPWMRERWDVSLFIGVAIEFLLGWFLFAGALSYAQAVRVLEVGREEGFEAKLEAQDVWVGPILVACVAAVLAFLFGAPVVPLPVAIACLFLRQHWLHWIAFGVAVVGVFLGVAQVAWRLAYLW